MGALESLFAGRPGYRRVYPDLPGTGRTSAPETVDGADAVLDTLLVLVDDVIGQETFLVVGHSYGGYLARAIANRRPGQVAGLALICSLAGEQEAGTSAAAAERIAARWQLRTAPEQAPAYATPTLILAGRQDATVGYAGVWRLLEHYPRATFAVLDRAGHGLVYEQVGLVTALMAEWLDRVREDAAGA